MTDKEIILNFCTEEFFKSGLKNVTMDFVAQNLKISKKTIYKVFQSKDELINEVVDTFLQEIKERYSDIVSSDETTIVKLKKIYEFVQSFLLRMGNNWMVDLKYQNPTLWEKVDSFRTNLMYNQLGKLIEQGKREEVIMDRPNEIIVTIMIFSMRGVVNPEFLMNNNFSARQAAEHVISILFNGILTKKGRKIFKELNQGV